EDGGKVVVRKEERTEPLGGPLPAERVRAADVVEAAKNGQEYHLDEAGHTWTLVKKTQQPILYVHPAVVASPEMREFVRTFHLEPGLNKYDVKVEALTPFPATYSPEGVTTLDLETRSLLQVLYFLSQGVEVPPEPLGRELVRVTLDEQARVFDWQQVLRGLFKVSYASGQKPPGARVAVQYRGYWFYIDERDQDTLTTFSLLLELSRLELTGQAAPGPVLTLPLSGR